MKRSVLLSMMAENETALANRWSAAARAASSGSNWVAANLKRRAAYAQRDAAAQAASASPYAASRANPSSSSRRTSAPVSTAAVSAEGAAEFSRLNGRDAITDNDVLEAAQLTRLLKAKKPKTASGWASLAAREYRKLWGRYPETEAEIARSEDFVGMPDKYRSVIMDEDPAHNGEVSEAGMETFRRLNKREPVTDTDYLEVQALTRLAKAKKPATAEGWEVLAQDEFDRKYGRIPETDSEIAEAEEYVGMPEKFRSGGAPVPVPAPPVAEASDLPDAWDDYHESGLSGMGEENRKAVFRDILSRQKYDGEAALSGSDRRFLGEYKAAALADYSRNGTAGIDPEHYEFLKETGYFDGSSVKNRRAHYEGLCNRVEAGASELLRNIGWTDEARIASLLARRVGASESPIPCSPGGPSSKGVLPPDGTPPITRPYVSPPPSGMPPAGEGTYIKAGGKVWQIRGGKKVLIGSDKVVSFSPNGGLLVTLKDGRVIDLTSRPPARLDKRYSSNHDISSGFRSDFDGRRTGSLKPGQVWWGNYLIDLNTGAFSNG